MIQGKLRGDVRVMKQGDYYGDMMHVFYCKECGFVEFFKEASSKEPWRWQKERQAPSIEKPEEPTKKKQPTKASRERLVR